MITLEKLQITEHESMDLVNPELFDTKPAFEWEKELKRDYKTLVGKARVGKNEVHAEVLLCKFAMRGMEKEVRKAALQNLLAHLAETLLENNGGVI